METANVSHGRYSALPNKNDPFAVTQLSLLALLVQRTGRSLLNKDRYDLTVLSLVIRHLPVPLRSVLLSPLLLFISPFLFCASPVHLHPHSFRCVWGGGVIRQGGSRAPGPSVRGSFRRFNWIRRLVGNCRPSSSPVAAVTFITRPIKKDLIE